MRQSLFPAVPLRHAAGQSSCHVGRVQYGGCPEKCGRLLDDHAHVRADSCALKASDPFCKFIRQRFKILGFDAVLDIAHQLLPVLLRSLSALLFQEALYGLNEIAFTVPELEVVQPVRVLHGAQPRCVVDHIGCVVCKGVKHPSDAQRRRRVGLHRLRHTDILNGTHIPAVLLLRAVQCFLCRFNGPVVLLCEFLIAVGFHAGLVAVVGKNAGSQLLQAVRDPDLFRGQSLHNGLNILRRKMDHVCSSGDLGLSGDLDLRLHDAAFQQMVLRLLAFAQKIQLHGLCRGQVQLPAFRCGEMVDFLIHGRHRVFTDAGFRVAQNLVHLFRQIPRHDLLTVLRVPQHPVNVLAGLPKVGEERIGRFQADGHVVTQLPPPGHAVHAERIGKLLGGREFLRRQRLACRGHGMLHGFQHVPHGFQLLCGQVRKAGVTHLDNLAESTGHIVTAQKGRVHNHIAIFGDILILLFQILERHRPVRRRTRILVNAFLRHGVQRKGPCIGSALLIDAFQHLCHGGTHFLRDVLVVRGPQQLLRQCAGMANDLCPQLSPLLIVPPGHVLLPVTLLQSLHLLRPPGPFLCQCLCRAAQPLCIPFALRHLTGQKSVIRRLPALESGFLHLLRCPVRKGLFRLGQVKEPVHNVIGDRRHGLSHVAFKGVVLRHLVQPVRHVRDPLHLVGDVGILRFVEKLRILAGQLGIDLVNVGVFALVDFQLAEQALAELVEVRDLGGIRFCQRQLGVFQILPQAGVFLVCPVVHLYGAFRDPLRNGIRPPPRLCIGQLVPAVLAAGNVVIQALQIS